MSDPKRYRLNAADTVVLGASGGGTASIGPSGVRGPANWQVTGVILKTSRPGEAPVPRAEVYIDRVAPECLQGITYDGSFAPGRCNFTIARGQTVIVVWAGGDPGDQASVTLTGEKW